VTFAAHRFQALLKVRQPIAALDCVPIETAAIVGDDDVQLIADLGNMEFHFRCRRMADDIVQGFLCRENETVPDRFSERDRAALDPYPEAANDGGRGEKLPGITTEVIGK
jgi:hypothetical protein